MEKMELSMREKINRVRINNEIGKVAIDFKLPENITEKVFQLYLKAKRKGLLKRKDLKTIFAACLYVTIRKEEIPQTITDVIRKLNVSLKKTEHLSKVLVQGLEIKFPPINISSLIDRFCADLELSDKVKSKAEKILKKATKAGLTNGLSSKGVAVAIVYIAAKLEGEHCTQKEISDATGVTDVTIRSRYKAIAKELDIDALL